MVHVPRSATGLGAGLDKAVFGHRTHVACLFGILRVFGVLKGESVTNTSFWESAESDRPTAGRAGQLDAFRQK